MLDFVAAFGSPLQALMYSRLFWPEFVEIDGMVFLKESMEYDDDRRRLAEALEYYGGDLTQTEQSFNLVEVPSSLFTDYEALNETTEEEDLWLAQRLAQMWRACLSNRYPGREFILEVLQEDTGGGDAVSVIFYQHRP
jgi:hypothetical protein